MKKFIIAIDFDGVIAQINKHWIPGTANIPGPLVEGADTYIKQLYEDGHQIIIWTCRGGQNLWLAEQYLEEHGIPFHRINDNVESHYDRFKHNTRKVHADIYIDDNQIGGIPSWAEMYEIITNKSKE